MGHLDNVGGAAMQENPEFRNKKPSKFVLRVLAYYLVKKLRKTMRRLKRQREAQPKEPGPS
jgi:hypothetical protein